jgi:DNA-binding response OmpR family regulator
LYAALRPTTADLLPLKAGIPSAPPSDYAFLWLTRNQIVKRTLLIVEDEPEIGRALKENLEIEGFTVFVSSSGEDALRLLGENPVHLVILDLLLPGMNGFETCEAIRKKRNEVPILMLTALGEEHQKVRGLELGADDYVTKPFGMGELIARIKALLRRAAGEIVEEPNYRFGSVEIDFARYELRRGGRAYHLSHNEREILRLLVSRPGEPIRRSAFLDAVWGVEAFPTNRTIDNYIVKLRRMIEDDPAAPRHIMTIYGVGYKFVP